MEKFRAVIYCRLSRDDGGNEESNSITNQRQLCRDFVKKQADISLVHKEIVDDGATGSNFDRDGIKIINELISNKEINCIIVKDLSRFGRDYLTMGNYLERVFPQNGIRFIAINDGYDSLKSDKYVDSFMLPIRNLINETYCQDISTKIRSSLDTKRKKGEYVGAFTPYGYKKSSESKNSLVVDEQVKENIIMIFSLFKSGLSILEITSELNNLGVLTPYDYKLSQGVRFRSSFKTVNHLWDYNMVRRILTNDIYAGDLVQGKRTTPNHKVRVTRLKNKSDWIRVEDSHEPIVSKRDFNAVNELLMRDMRSSKSKKDNYLSGYLYCADCGEPMHKKVVQSRGKVYYYYVCSGHKKYKNCSTHNIACHLVEDYLKKVIQQQIQLILELDEILDDMDQQVLEDYKMQLLDKQITSLAHECDVLQQRKYNLYNDYTDGLLTQDEYTQYKNRYEDDIADKLTKKEKVETEKINLKQYITTEKEWVSKFKELKNIEEIDRRALLALVDKILIHEKHKIEVVFKFSDFYAEIIKYLEEEVNE